MKKLIKIFGFLIIITALVILLLKFILPMYFRFNPTEFTDYQTKDTWDNSLNDTLMGMGNELPVGGCWNTCNGETSVVSCKHYNLRYDECEFQCHGYLYNNCDSGTLGSLLEILTR